MDGDKWLEYFQACGHCDVQFLAAGMESIVYNLGGGQIGKVWKRRSASELRSLQSFYRHLETQSLPFATPLIRAICVHGGAAITVERRLPGTPLQTRLALGDATISVDVLGAFTDVLSALSRVGDAVDIRGLNVLDAEYAFLSGKAGRADALLALMERRVQLYGGHLRAQIEHFDAKYARLRTLIAAQDPSRHSLVHGDLFGGNILVDDRLRPLGVLDFGFLTLLGDPVFDASIASGIINMYGPYARFIDDQAMDHFSRILGYSRDQMLTYRAAYAVMTSNAYDAAGRDGHFEWCVRQLQRDDVKDILTA